MVQECACWFIRRTAFDVYICLNHSLRYKHNKLEKCLEKPRHQKVFFQNLENFQIKVFFVNGETAFLVAL